MAVVQEKRNPDLQDDDLQTTQTIHNPWTSEKAVQNEPGFLRDHQRPGRACQEDCLLQAYRGTHGIVESTNTNDMHTPHLLEEPTTAYICEKVTVTTLLLQHIQHIRSHILSSWCRGVIVPRILHIFVIGFDSFRQSVTDLEHFLQLVMRFDSFRLFILARPNSRYEDRTEAHWQNPDSKDLAGLRRSKL